MQFDENAYAELIMNTSNKVCETIANSLGENGQKIGIPATAATNYWMDVLGTIVAFSISHLSQFKVKKGDKYVTPHEMIDELFTAVKLGYPLIEQMEQATRKANTH